MLDVDGRVDAAIGQFAIEHEFHVAGAFELLEDQVVHAASGVDEGGADDGERAAFFKRAGRGEEFLGNVHCFDVDTAAHGAARVADPLVEGAGEAGDGVEQEEDVFSHFGESLATLDRELGKPDMAFDIAIEAGGEYFAFDDALHVGDFFGTFVDEQHHHGNFGVVFGNAGADVLNEDRFAGARRCHDERALAFSERREEVHHAGADRLLARFELEPFFGVDGCEVVERLYIDVVIWWEAIDIENFFEARALAAAMTLDHAGDKDTFAEAELFDHCAGHKGIGAFACEVGLRVAEKAVTVGVHFEHAGAGYERQVISVLLGVAVWAAVLAILLVVVASSAAATVTTATTASSAVVSTLAVVISITPAASAGVSAAAPTLFLCHVFQNLYLDPLATNRLGETFANPCLNKPVGAWPTIRSETDAV